MPPPVVDPLRTVAACTASSSVLEAEPGKGTTFHLLLPLASVTEAPSVTIEPSVFPPGRLNGILVLLVDDDLGVAEGVAACLEAEGAQVKHAETGPVALRLLDSGLRPQRIILDLGLPEMSGDVVHGEIRKRFSRLPVIISSGYGDGARISRLLDDGFTSYLQKPYEMEELISKVHDSPVASVER